MTMNPSMSRAWSGSSLLEAAGAVQTHYDKLLSSSLSEEEMKEQLRVPCLQQRWVCMLD